MAIKTVSQSLDDLNVKLGGTAGAIEPSTTKADALKAIYSTLGGTDDVSNISTVSEMVDKVTEVAEAGGSVPTVNVTFKNSTTTTMKLNGPFSSDGSFSNNQLSLSSGRTETVAIPAKYAINEANAYVFLTSATMNPSGKKVSVTKTAGSVLATVAQDDISNISSNLPKLYIQLLRITEDCEVTIAYVNE